MSTQRREYECTDPTCDARTLVVHYAHTFTDPGYPDRDTCEGRNCDADLDWETGDEPEAPEPEMADLADEAYERAGDR